MKIIIITALIVRLFGTVHILCQWTPIAGSWWKGYKLISMAAKDWPDLIFWFTNILTCLRSASISWGENLLANIDLLSDTVHQVCIITTRMKYFIGKRGIFTLCNFTYSQWSSPLFSQEISPAVSAFLASPETTVKQMLLNKCYNKVTITITFTRIVISIKSLSPPSIGSPSSWLPSPSSPLPLSPSLSWKRLETNRCWVLFWIRQSSSYSRCYL